MIFHNKNDVYRQTYTDNLSEYALELKNSCFGVVHKQYLCMFVCG